MRARILWVLVALILATTACTAILGDFSTSGGDDTTTDGSTADATGADGSSGADGSPADSGTDSGPQGFCDTQTAPPDASDFHCADFDGTNFEDGFFDASVNDGGSLTKDTSLFFSSPNSVSSSIASVAPGKAYLFWQRGGPNVVNHITLSAAIKEDFVETLGSPNGVIEVLTLNVGPAANQYIVAFVYALGQTNATAGGTFSGYSLMIELPAQAPSFYPTGVLSQAGAFTNVKLDYNGATHLAQVFYDGSNVSLQNYASLTGNLTVQALVGGNSVNIGLTELQGQWNIDNVLFSTTP